MRRRFIPTIIIILSAIALTIWVSVNNWPQETANSSDVLTTASAAPTGTPLPNTSIELDPVRYTALINELDTILQKQDSFAALMRFRELVSSDKSILASCHTIAHELGRRSYRKYRNFGKAVSYQDDICGSGYLHGVIEAHFESVSDVEAELKVICKEDDGRCFHGVGHGVMYYTSNDLPRSLALCDTYESSFARSYCGEGVFMENFNSDQSLHLSTFLDYSDPFYPCPLQTSFYKGACYYYAPAYYLTVHKNDYTKALDWCETAEKPYIPTCTVGLGSRILKYNLYDPKKAEQFCMSGSPSQTAQCIDGMVSYSILNYNDLEPARIMCSNMESQNIEICNKALVRHADLLTD